MGNWALSQAQAFQRQDLELLVVSLRPALPRIIPRIIGKRLSAHRRSWFYCPPRHVWNGVVTEYPRWAYYEVGPLDALAFRWPRFFIRLALFSSVPSLMKLVRRFKPDVIYAHHSSPNGYVAAHLRRRFGLPYVVTDHDYDEITSCTKYSDRRKLFAKVAGGAAMMCPVSNQMALHLTRLFPGIRVRTIHNGVDPPDPSVRNHSMPRPTPNDAKRIRIFSAGAFAERKAFPLLVEAFGQISANHPDAELRIAGDGRDRPRVEYVIDEFGLRDQVHLLGFQPHAVVLKEIAACDIFALLSWDEPWGVVYAEAFAAGKPIICASDAGITDVFQNGVHGVSVPPGDSRAAADALDELLSDAKKRIRMGIAARELCEEGLSWDANAKSYAQLFRGLVAGNR